MGRKILGVILGIITLITAWSTINMFVALAHKGNHLVLSYAPLLIELTDPNSTLIIISAVIYTIITIGFALITLKLFKSKY
ncbi:MULTISPECIES: hypothetical protein [unclassified Staphylococcus]|uniref:hypothetical protein n=1 Tax=unclassified Staphylococcus TaxID=91994 RepID=UPI0021D11236|nr:MULTISPECIES: hypothetical protein [unclassified Staphylococcus]UXR78243.1 hypothetical protein MUA92_10505 [Staphylococcus sp. IVB6227]UXR82407.1 hypothetical protein MUA51_10225 [Staphylococcus sp. IVB6214]